MCVIIEIISQYSTIELMKLFNGYLEILNGITQPIVISRLTLFPSYIYIEQHFFMVDFIFLFDFTVRPFIFDAFNPPAFL